MTSYLSHKSTYRPAAVIGAGTLGRRIALMLAVRGGTVHLYDTSSKALEASMDYIQAMLPQITARLDGGKVGTVRPTFSLESAIGQTWLVIEALPEILDAKKELFGLLDQKAPVDAILATNSSSYPSSTMIAQVQNKNRVLNTHFMMPPEQCAVELMSCGHTDKSLPEELAAYFRTLGLSPYIARKESVGFIENRIWAAIKREALCVAAEGIATPETIDQIYCETQKTPMGPFRAMDRVGLDIVLQIEEHYAEIDKTLPEAPRLLLQKMIAENRLGLKSGRGFYDYSQGNGPL